MNALNVLLLQAIVVLLSVAVTALPNGAPTCETGKAAPQQLHLERARNPLTGEISLEGYQVFIDEVQVVQGEPFPVEVGVDHVIRIKSSTNNVFKGALVLLSKEGEIYNPYLSVTNSLFKVSPNCEGEAAAGLTHVDRSIKTQFEGGLKLEKNAKQIYLDVNIVPQNNSTRSIYYFSRFELEAVGGSSGRSPVFKRCGLLGLSVVCPLSQCGWLGRIFWRCKV